MSPQEGYQHGDAFNTGDLQVTETHRIHFEQYGKPDGKPGELLLLLIIVDDFPSNKTETKKKPQKKGIKILFKKETVQQE